MSKYTDKICPIMYSSKWVQINCVGEECAWFNKCYTPTIEVSEDCVSREWLIKAIDNLDWYDFDMFYKVVENAPSVVPCCDNEKSNKLQQELQQAEATTEQSSKVGEWIDNGDRYFRCSLCGAKDTDTFRWCHGCGNKIKG